MRKIKQMIKLIFSLALLLLFNCSIKKETKFNDFTVVSSSCIKSTLSQKASFINENYLDGRTIISSELTNGQKISVALCRNNCKISPFPNSKKLALSNEYDEAGTAVKIYNSNDEIIIVANSLRYEIIIQNVTTNRLNESKILVKKCYHV